MHNPCFECWNRYGHSYTEECDNTCEYAHALSKLKPYGGITADIYYKIFKEDLELWEKWEAEEDD